MERLAASGDARGGVLALGELDDPAGLLAAAG